MKILMIVLMLGVIPAAGQGTSVLTFEEAATKIRALAESRTGNDPEPAEAVEALRELTEAGIPVDLGYRVVQSAIMTGGTGKETAGLVRAVIAAPGPIPRREAAVIALRSLREHYTPRESMELTISFGQLVSNGAPALETAEVMNAGIARNISTSRIESLANRFAGEVRSGIPPERAVRNAVDQLERSS